MEKVGYKCMRTKNNLKTVFIAISRGFIVRNILRSGVLDKLKEKNYKIVIFFPYGKDENEKLALVKEFSNENVIVEFLPPDTDLDFRGIKGFFYRIFKSIAPYLVYSHSTWTYSRIGNMRKMNRSIFWSYLEKYTYGVLSHVHFLKHIARFIEMRIFYEPKYAQYFKKYNPNVVFAASVVSKQDIQFMKDAKRFGVKTVSMPKGWDNISKMLYRVAPDVLVVQNEIMKDDAIHIQRLHESHVKVCGFPQFDWYRHPEILMSRENLFSLLGLDSKKRLLFFGSEGVWAPNDDTIAATLSSLVAGSQGLVKECAVLIRPHFSDVHNKRFDKFKGLPNVRVDENFTLSNYFNDNWNPSLEETKLFVNCLYHSDVMITVASTLVLDAVAYDKPSIGIAYGVLYNPKTGKDVSEELYETDHFHAVMVTGAVDLVRTEKELVESINNALVNPEKKKNERENLLKNLCYRVDGNSSKRIVDVIDSV